MSLAPSTANGIETAAGKAQVGESRRSSGTTTSPTSDPKAEDDDRELIERAQQGDQRAFRDLYRRHAPRVFRYAILPLIRDRALAEDLLADTFVRALENIHRFKWQGKGVLPWLIRIGKNLCLDHLRRSGRQAAWPEGLEQMLPEPSRQANAEWMVGEGELADVLRERIASCIEAINPRYREVLRLRMIEKLPRKDAAERMDVTVGTLDVLLFRACKAFRKAYAERYGAGPGSPEFVE